MTERVDIMTVPREIQVKHPRITQDQRSGGGEADDDGRRRESQQPLFVIPNIGRVMGGAGSTWERSRQTLAVYLFSLYFLMPMVVVCWSWSVLFLVFPLTTIQMATYLGYIFLLDKSAESGRYPPWIRSWGWWSYACDYFPLILVKTADLPPEKSYVLGYHPHGIISVGAMGAFATDGAIAVDLSTKKNTAAPGKDGNNNDDDDDDDEIILDDATTGPRGFSCLFPGIDRRLVTLPVNFATPFLREYSLGMGCCDSNKGAFRTILTRNGGKGNAMVVVVGGAAESMLVKPGSMELVLDKRRGFVREAIISNACLVPVLAFGETDMYHVVEEDGVNGWVRTAQDWVKATTGVAVPLFQGRSFFFRDFGLMPLRKPLVVVVGRPIQPPSFPSNTIFNPLVDRNTREAQNEHGRILLEWHAKYVTAVKDLYHTYKDKDWNTAGRSRRESLRIVQ